MAGQTVHYEALVQWGHPIEQTGRQLCGGQASTRVLSQPLVTEVMPGRNPLAQSRLTVPGSPAREMECRALPGSVEESRQKALRCLHMRPS